MGITNNSGESETERFIDLMQSTGIFGNPYELRHFFDKHGVLISVLSYPDGLLLNVQGYCSAFMTHQTTPLSERVSAERRAIEHAFYCLEENINGQTKKDNVS